MEENTGVPVKKQKLLDKKVKTDLKKIFTAFSKSAIMYFSGKPESAAKEFVSVIDAFEFSTDVSDLSYRLILTSLVNSAHKLAEENSGQFIAAFEDEEKLYDNDDYVEFLDGITDLIEDKEIILDFEMIKNPRLVPIIDDFKKYFSKYLVLFGIPEKDAELIGNRLPSYFVFELNNELRNSFSRYEALIQNLNAPSMEAARKERQWEAYCTYLEREVEKPVFGESFSLNDIFIPLRAYHKEGKKVRGKNRKVAVELEVVLDKWLKSNRSEDTIRIIQGGPGSGKSSFVKWWAAKLSQERNVPVLFFPLHHFNIHTSVKAAISEYFKDSENIPLDFNPLEEGYFNQKILLIFDGLDELVMQGKTSKEAANSFIQELKDFCRLKNEGKQRVQVLITGRPIAVQDTEAKLRDSNQQILFLLPYFLNNNQINDYEDVKDILNIDQRNEWWNQFFTLKGLSNHDLPEELRNKEMDKITTEPLLNYLVALSWKDAPEKFDENTNINNVYYQLMLGVYAREYDNKRKYRGISDLTLDDFIQILEEIAICAWQGGDARVTTERKIQEHINNRGLGQLLEEYKASVRGGGIPKLLTAFYFRKFGKEDTENKDDTFEFTHKSFGEYLAARAIVELITAIHEERTENKRKAVTRRDKRKGWTIQQVLSEWLRATCRNTIDRDINKFIINEIKLRSDAGENVVEWQTSLCEVIEELLITGMPLHLQEKRFSQIEEMRLARNSEEALLVALTNCARITGKTSQIKWKDIYSPAAWFSRLSTSLRNKDFAFKNLSRIDLSGMFLDPINLLEANLDGANLEKVTMTLSNLSMASAIRANFKEANLNSSKFGVAQLLEANFSEAKLGGVDFKAADLTGADLTGANLTGANLTGAKLTGANLTGADLTRADLTGANLSGANLTEANLMTAKLGLSQLLSSKSLSGVRNLSPDILNQIKVKKPGLLKKLE